MNAQVQVLITLALAEDINLGAPGCGVAPVLAVLVDVAALVLPDDDL